MRWPAKRISDSSEKSLGMYTEAMALESQGVDIIHLEVGRPDADTPQHIKDAAKEALDQGLVHYGHPAGNAGFRQSIVAKLAEYNAISVSPDEIIVTNGLTHAAYITCMAALDPGDEVILLEPYYPQHINKIELAGATVVTAALDASREFRIEERAIRSKITPRTRMISLVNPANPTGRVYDREELMSIARIAREHDLLVMSDEVYEQIVYDGRQHVSIASLPGMAERTISHFAFTKAFAMDGWRLGYLAASGRYVDALMKVSLNDVTHVNVFIQEGGRAALSGPQDSRLQMLENDRRRRDLVCARLNEIPGVRCPVPEGTIYAFPDISSLGIPDVQFARELLHQKQVAVEAGSFYGPAGKGHIRICFGSEPFERLQVAMDRIADYVNDREFRRAAEA